MAEKSVKGNDMSPVVKYSICAGIIIVTTGVVIGIVKMRGLTDDQKPQDDDQMAREGDEFSKPIPGRATKMRVGKLVLLSNGSVTRRPDGKFYEVTVDYVFQAAPEPDEQYAITVALGDATKAKLVNYPVKWLRGDALGNKGTYKGGFSFSEAREYAGPYTLVMRRGPRADPVSDPLLTNLPGK